MHTAHAQPFIGEWRFKPYKLNGEAVEVESELILYFHPDR
jgi:hypothetical protein